MAKGNRRDLGAELAAHSKQLAGSHRTHSAGLRAAASGPAGLKPLDPQPDDPSSPANLNKGDQRGAPPAQDIPTPAKLKPLQPKPQITGPLTM